MKKITLKMNHKRKRRMKGTIHRKFVTNPILYIPLM